MAGRRYSCTDTTALDSTADTALNIVSNASTTHRMWFYDLLFSNGGTPADLTSTITVGRTTDAGTGDTPTIETLDPADRASLATPKGNLSSECTYGDTVLEFDLNHRAVLRWVAPPGGEIVTPATANNGLGGKSSHASATTEYRVTMFWVE